MRDATEVGGINNAVKFNALSEFFEAEDNYEVYFVGTVRIEGYYEKNNKHTTYTNCSNLSYIL